MPDVAWIASHKTPISTIAGIMVEIYSLQFELATEPPRSEFIVVPLPKGARIAWPGIPGKSWLDVEVGDVIRVEGRRRIVKQVSPYRTSLCISDHPDVKCGQDWLREIRRPK